MTEPLFDDILASEKLPPKRTLPVTIICIIYLTGIVMLLIQVVGRSKSQSALVAGMLSLAVIVIAGLTLGLWKMRKWAGIAFIVLVGLSGVAALVRGAHISGPAYSLLMIIVIATQLKKMH